MSDTLPTTKATPEVAFCFLLNQLLERERWARERLAAFEGQVFELRAPLPLFPPLRCTIGGGGHIEAGGTEPAAVVTLSGIDGDSALAVELRYLAKHLRPDIEEELSRVLGDVPAQRLAGAARGLLRWQADAFARVGEALADYASDEARLVVRRAQLGAFAGDLQRLAEAIARLEERTARLA